MKTRLISHSSVVIETADTQIWTDPWLTGKVFNNSWTMFPGPAWDPAMLNTIDYIWLSHEHPDHFHLPTLKGLPEAFKRKVTILFQQKNSEKIFDALKASGYSKFRTLPHREFVNLTPRTRLYCYEVGVMDSCLGVLEGDRVLLNINDASVNSRDCRAMRADLGRKIHSIALQADRRPMK